MPHFIYCGLHYLFEHKKLEEIILTKMRKYGIQSSILTMLNMERWKLVTKEKVKKAAEGKLKNENGWKDCEGSINDDLERLIINLQNQQVENIERIYSFFTPKLTNEELKLVEMVDEDHLKTYLSHYNGNNPDVNIDEMKTSDSKSKYVHGHCMRFTVSLTLDNLKQKRQMLN